MHSTRIDLSAKGPDPHDRCVERPPGRRARPAAAGQAGALEREGPSFIALHELFDRIAGETAAHVDDIAERITALGGVAEGTVQAVAGRTRLDAYPLHIVDGRSHLDALAAALAKFGKAVRKAIDEARRRAMRTPAICSPHFACRRQEPLAGRGAPAGGPLTGRPSSRPGHRAARAGFSAALLPSRSQPPRGAPCLGQRRGPQP